MHTSPTRSDWRLPSPGDGHALARWRPDVVFTTGGYVAIPVVMAGGSDCACRALMWEGNLVPGRSVRATARLTSALAVSFAETCAALPGKCFVTGTPIRSFAGREGVGAARRWT